MYKHYTTIKYTQYKFVFEISKLKMKLINFNYTKYVFAKYSNLIYKVNLNN